MIYSGIQKTWLFEESLRFIVSSLEKAKSIDQQGAIYADLLTLTDGMGSTRFDLNRIDPCLLDKLRCLRSSYVFSLEGEWARRIINSQDDLESLHQVQYFRSYHNMVEDEVGFLKKVLNKPIRRVVFVGSGPFPFSSYCLVREFGIRVVNVDIDQEALETSRELSTAAGVKKGIDYICCDARDFKLDSSADAVIVAALVGHHADDKHEIINSLGAKLNKHQVLAARTGRGVKQLFYVGVDKDRVGLQHLGTSIASRNVINSLAVFKKS